MITCTPNNAGTYTVSMRTPARDLMLTACRALVVSARQNPPGIVQGIPPEADPLDAWEAEEVAASVREVAGGMVAANAAAAVDILTQAQGAQVVTFTADEDELLILMGVSNYLYAHGLDAGVSAAQDGPNVANLPTDEFGNPVIQMPTNDPRRVFFLHITAALAQGSM